MKKWLVLAALTTACASTGPGGGLMSLFSGSSLKLRPYRMQTLPNGMKIYFIRDESLPRVSLQALVKVGFIHEPEDLLGLNGLTVSLLDKGTATRSATKLAEELNSVGTGFSGSAGEDTSYFSASTLTPQADKLLELFADIMLNPAFHEAELRRERAQFKAAIRRRVDSPGGYANYELDRYLFGDHPLGRDRTGTEASLDRMKRTDILRHYLAWYRPNNTLLAVTGRYGPDFEKKVVDAFSRWKRRDIKPPELPPLPTIDRLSMRLVSRPQQVQAQVRLAKFSVPYRHPDHYALRLANEILGGGFGARLMQKIRDDLGLTYGISSSLSSGRTSGVAGISTSTRNDAVGKAVTEILGVYRSFGMDGVKGDELAMAKAQLIGQFPRAFETADGMAYRLLLADHMDLPFSEMADFPRIIDRVSLSEVNTVIRKYYSGDALKILVYGDRKAIAAQLKPWNPEIVER